VQTTTFLYFTQYARNSQPKELDDNEEKSRALYETFFPCPPADPQADLPTDYPDPICEFTPITDNQVHRAIRRLAPFKAPGPNGICNIVFIRCADQLVPWMGSLFQATFSLVIFPNKWLTSKTVVIWKPSHPDYSAPKAYRPHSSARHYIQNSFLMHSRRPNLDHNQTQVAPPHPFRRTPWLSHNWLASSSNQVRSQCVGPPNRPPCFPFLFRCQGCFPKCCPWETPPQHVQMWHPQAVHWLVPHPPHRKTDGTVLWQLHFPLLQHSKWNQPRLPALCIQLPLLQCQHTRHTQSQEWWNWLRLHWQHCFWHARTNLLSLQSENSGHDGKARWLHRVESDTSCQLWNGQKCLSSSVLKKREIPHKPKEDHPKEMYSHHHHWPHYTTHQITQVSGCHNWWRTPV